MVSSLPGSLEGPDSPSPCHACTHLPRHGYTGGLVAPMYNQPSSSLRYSPYTHSHTWRPRSVCAVLYAVSKQPSLPTALDLKMDICFLDIQAFMFLSLLRVDAWIVHEHYWLLPGSLGSLGSITAGKSACSLLRATPHECWVYHKKGTVTIGLTVQTENVSHSSSENLLSMTNLSHYWRELTGQCWKNYL